MIKEFEYLPNYEDIEILDKEGVWKGNTIPEWVEERVKAWKCTSSHDPMIRECAMKYEIVRLQEMLKHVMLFFPAWSVEDSTNETRHNI